MSGTLVFKNHEAEKTIEIPIINNNSVDDDNDDGARDFNIILSNPTNKSRIVTEYQQMNIRITEDEEYAGIINKVLHAIEFGEDLTTHTWKEQFIEALEFSDDDPVAMFMHVLNFPWKVLFAFIPPTNYYNGWLTFICSLTAIGLVTMIIGELASMFGCFLNMSEGVVAMTIVALGTSMPDTFASVTATQMADTADAAIGNITGSNSVNVFLGLGLPWLMAAIYAEATKEPYVVPKGTVATSVLIFSSLATMCLGLMIYREKSGIGVLGGTLQGRKYLAAFFTLEWFIFIMVTVLEDAGAIKVLAS